MERVFPGLKSESGTQASIGHVTAALSERSYRLKPRNRSFVDALKARRRSSAQHRTDDNIMHVSGSTCGIQMRKNVDFTKFLLTIFYFAACPREIQEARSRTAS